MAQNAPTASASVHRALLPGTIVFTPTASCRSVNVPVPMVIVCERSPPAFAATLYCHVPGPVPFPAGPADAHEGRFAPVQEQAAGVVIATAPEPAAEPNVSLVGAIENVHPVSIRVKVCPAIVIVPLRAAFAAFGAPVLAATE